MTLTAHGYYYWMVKLVCNSHVGPYHANVVGNIHEECLGDVADPSRAHTEMDLSNSAVGVDDAWFIKTVGKCDDDAFIIDAGIQAVEAKRLYWIL